MTGHDYKVSSMDDIHDVLPIKTNIERVDGIVRWVGDYRPARGEKDSMQSFLLCHPDRLKDDRNSSVSCTAFGHPDLSSIKGEDVMIICEKKEGKNFGIKTSEYNAKAQLTLSGKASIIPLNDHNRQMATPEGAPEAGKYTVHEGVGSGQQNGLQGQSLGLLKEECQKISNLWEIAVESTLVSMRRIMKRDCEDPADESMVAFTAAEVSSRATAICISIMRNDFTGKLRDVVPLGDPLAEPREKISLEDKVTPTTQSKFIPATGRDMPKDGLDDDDEMQNFGNDPF